MALTSSRSLNVRDRRLACRLGVSRHRPGPLLPRRHHRSGPRADRRGQGRVRRPATPRRPCLRVRPLHQPGLRRLGRHLRGGAPQAPPGQSPASARPQQLPPADPAGVGTRRPPYETDRTASPRGGRSASGSTRDTTGTDSCHHGPGPGRAGGRRAANSMVPVQLAPPGRARSTGRGWWSSPGRTRPTARPRRRPRPRAASPVVGQLDPDPAPLRRRQRAGGIGVVHDVLEQLGERPPPATWPPARAACRRRPSIVKSHRAARARSAPPPPCAPAAARSRRSRTSSPSSRDSVSCTSAIERMRRTDSSIAALADGSVRRRPCRRSSDEIVWRLFFTRWWISLMVASLETSRRSRLRSSETSRSSTTAPSTRRGRAAGCSAAPR